MTGPHPDGSVRRFRAGSQAPVSAAQALFLLLAAVALAAVAVREHRPVFDLLGAGVAVLGLWWLLDSLNGLRPVRVHTGPAPVLSLPTFSPRRGYRRTLLPWTELTDLDLDRTSGLQFPYRRLRVVSRGGEVTTDSLTCSARRRHPERTRVGRAVAEIGALLGFGPS